MTRRALAAGLTFLVAGILTWLIPAILAAPEHRSSHGGENVRTLDVGRGEAASWKWEFIVHVEEPDVVSPRVGLPFAQSPTSDAGAGADTRIDALANGVSVSRFRFDGTAPSEIEWPDPLVGAAADWSGLKSGANTVTIFANFSILPGEYPKSGSVTVRAGPATFEASYADSDRDLVADVNQPIRSIPTYLVAVAAGVIASIAARAFVRRLPVRDDV